MKINGIHHRKRDKLIEKLKERGIETRPGFYPLNKMEPFRKYCRSKYSSSEEVSFKSISLPSSPFLSKSELKYISTTFLEEIKKII